MNFDPELESAGKAMRRARLNAGLSLTDLKHKTGIPYYLLSNYENGKNAPGLKNLIRLADTLHLSLDAYIGRVTPPAKPSP